MENLLEAIIHAFVTTNLDYCNAILYGLPKVLLNHLTFTKKYEHIIPSLIDLHWLPVPLIYTTYLENLIVGI